MNREDRIIVVPISLTERQWKGLELLLVYQGNDQKGIQMKEIGVALRQQRLSYGKYVEEQIENLLEDTPG